MGRIGHSTIFDMLREVEASAIPSAPANWNSLSDIKIHSMSPLRFSLVVGGKEYELVTDGKPTELYRKNSEPINSALMAYFTSSGKKQAKELKVLEGDTEPWSRSLEEGEVAFVLDKALGTPYSDALWTAYEENIPDRQIVALVDGSWMAVLNDNIEMTGNAVK